MTEQTGGSILPTENNDILIQCIDDEVKYAGEGSVMRTRLLRELSGIYGHTPLIRSFQVISKVVAHSERTLANTHPDTPPGVSQRYPHAIYTGTLLATRSLLHPDVLRTPRLTQLRKDILSSSFLAYQPNSAGEYVHISTDGYAADQCREQVDLLVDAFPSVFNSQDQDLRDTLINATDKLYSDMPNGRVAAEFENRFLLGFFLGGTAISSLASEISVTSSFGPRI